MVLCKSMHLLLGVACVCGWVGVDVGEDNLVITDIYIPLTWCADHLYSMNTGASLLNKGVKHMMNRVKRGYAIRRNVLH